MPIRKRRGWELPESAATSESVFRQRRRLIRAAAAGPVLLGVGALVRGGRAAPAETTGGAPEGDPTTGLYPVDRNSRYTVSRPVTDEFHVATYNNYYEFGSQKDIASAAQELPIRPWEIRFDGLVEKEFTLGVDELIRRMPLEERVYRHRCVEAWAMTVPWSGFPLKALVDMARPLGSAKYLRMETFVDKDVAPGQRQFWYPWPYVEGLTIAEATNELAFVVTGSYGHPLPKQNGSPLRLAVPWKYGFKSTKAMVRFTFAEARPKTFWEEVQGDEYGFWANVNPEVPHPRWSQAEERLLGSDEKVPTRLFNGYGEYVAHLYEGHLDDRRYFF